MFERSPLSPVRPWAARHSGTVCVVAIVSRPSRRSPARRPRGSRHDNVPSVGAERRAHAAATGGAAAVERGHLAHQALGARVLGVAQCNAQAHVARVAGGRGGQPAAAVVAEDAGDADQVDAQRPERLQALAQHVGGQPGARFGACAGVGDLALGEPAAFEADVDLQRAGAGVAAHAFEPHAVGSDLVHLRRADVGHDVGRQVGGRVVHLVEQLLLDRVLVDAAAGAGGLGDRAVPVGRRSRRSDSRGAPGRGRLLARVGVVAAGDLRAALEQVAGHRGARQTVPVVVRPAEVRERRADGERRIGDAAADHDLRAGLKRGGDRLGAEVGVGADDVAAVERRTERACSAARCAGPDTSSPAITAMRGAGRPCCNAISRMRSAAPRGLAAPKLLTMRTPPRRQRASTGASIASSSGS